MDQEAMNRLRQPHPAQKSVDTRSAALLQRSSRYSGQAKGANVGASSWHGPRQTVYQKPARTNTNS